MKSRQLDATICLLVSATLLLAYWLTMPKVVTFEDSGLFLQVCHFNGIAHPPGYPLFTLLCAPWFWLPFDPVILGNSLSALFAVLTCIVAYFILRRLGVSQVVAAITCLLLGFSRDFWSQAIIVEVYTLNTLLVSLQIYLALCFTKRPEKWQLFAISLLFGLSLSNHWPLVVLSAPGIALLCLGQAKALAEILRSPINFLSCLLLLALGLMPYVSLYLKSDPVFSYSGPVSSVAEFLAYFSRETYQEVDQTDTAGVMDKVQFVGWLGVQSLRQFGYGFAAIALVGLVRGFAIDRLVSLALLVIFLSNTLVLAFLLGFDFDFIHQAVFRPYLLVAWVCMSLWIGIALQWVSRMSGGRVVPILIVLFGVIMLVTNWQRNDRTDDRLAHEYAVTLLESLEPGANLIVTSDPQVGPISYLNLVVGLRPDVTLYEAQNLFIPNKLAGKTVAERKSYAENLPSVASVAIPWLPGGQDFGLFRKQGPELDGYGLVPETGGFISRLVDNYRSGGFRDPNTLYFSHQLLIALGNQLTHYAFTNRVGGQASHLFQVVKQTFPGMLAILSTCIANPNYPMPDNILLEMALAFDESFGIETPDHEIAAYYYYMAVLLTSPDATLDKDEAFALQLLEKGLKILPGRDNPGFKLHQELTAKLSVH
ncbi:MAG: hypothetical protein CMQ20_17430 [Gammaproteobacteria bacterium]|jgi:hypothetical protein|nr:hypothetical protein [Gammaproteobacteria bacterium]|tara:strand:+ start:34190 stop:36142 length:1953 start_codon:yes stop_codon:yes gene_type:complete